MRPATKQPGSLLTKRRKRLGASIVLALALLAGFLLLDRLSPTERALVGTWEFEDRIGGRYISRVVFAGDGRFTNVFVDPETDRVWSPPVEGRWWVRDGRLIFDYAPNRWASWGSGKSGPLALLSKPLGHDIRSLDEERLIMAPPQSKPETLLRRPPDRTQAPARRP